LGGHWRSNFDAYLMLTSASQIAYEQADGRVLNFALSGTTWTADTDVDLRLTHSGATWTLTDGNDTVRTFTNISAAEATLTSIRARNGHTQTLEYDPTTQHVTRVSDSFGRSLSFNYQGGLLQSVATPDGLVLTYAYSQSGLNPGVPDRLTSVSYSTTPV